jgi:hypothetical protein
MAEGPVAKSLQGEGASTGGGKTTSTKGADSPQEGQSDSKDPGSRREPASLRRNTRQGEAAALWRRLVSPREEPYQSIPT